MCYLKATKKYGGSVAWDTSGKRELSIEIKEVVALFVEKVKNDKM